jgi:hypothetical protein
MMHANPRIPTEIYKLEAKQVIEGNIDQGICQLSMQAKIEII